MFRENIFSYFLISVNANVNFEQKNKNEKTNKQTNR